MLDSASMFRLEQCIKLLRSDATRKHALCAVSIECTTNEMRTKSKELAAKPRLLRCPTHVTLHHSGVVHPLTTSVVSPLLEALDSIRTVPRLRSLELHFTAVHRMQELASLVWKGFFLNLAIQNVEEIRLSGDKHGFKTIATEFMQLSKLTRLDLGPSRVPLDGLVECRALTSLKLDDSYWRVLPPLLFEQTGMLTAYQHRGVGSDCIVSIRITLAWFLLARNWTGLRVLNQVESITYVDLLLDLLNCLTWVEMLRTSIRTIHDSVTAIQPE